jgi:MFS family permease
MASVVLAALLLSNDTPAKGAASPSRKASLSMLGFLREKKAYWLVAQYVFHTSAVSAAIYLSPLWLAALLNWGPREVGLLFGGVGLAMIVIQGALMDWLTSRFGLLAVLGAGAAIFALSLLATSVVTGVWPRALAIFMAFAGATCCLPVLNVISSSVVAAQERGRMMGITALAGSFGRVAGPLVSGAVLAVSGYKLAWLVVALPVLVVFGWSQTSARQYSRANQSGTEAESDTDPSVSVESPS